MNLFVSHNQLPKGFHHTDDVGAWLFLNIDSYFVVQSTGGGDYSYLFSRKEHARKFLNAVHADYIHSGNLERFMSYDGRLFDFIPVSVINKVLYQAVSLEHLGPVILDYVNNTFQWLDNNEIRYRVIMRGPHGLEYRSIVGPDDYNPKYIMAYDDEAALAIRIGYQDLKPIAVREILRRCHKTIARYDLPYNGYY